MYKFISLKKSTDGTHKYEATIYNETTKRNNVVKFGATGYSDYPTHKDEERKKRYLDRHRKNENWNDPTTAGALSRWVLWNKPTLRASIADFKRRFKLK